MIETEVLEMVRNLRERWEDASFRAQTRGTDYDIATEQRTWDHLVDYVEAHDLTDTEHDPRVER